MNGILVERCKDTAPPPELRSRPRSSASIVITASPWQTSAGRPATTAPCAASWSALARVRLQTVACFEQTARYRAAQIAETNEPDVHINASPDTTSAGTTTISYRRSKLTDGRQDIRFRCRRNQRCDVPNSRPVADYRSERHVIDGRQRAFPTFSIQWMFTLVHRRHTMQRTVAPFPCLVCGRLVPFVITATGKLDLICVDCPGDEPLYWPRFSRTREWRASSASLRTCVE